MVTNITKKSVTDSTGETTLIKTSDAMADFLAEHGIRHAFGIIGAGNAHLFDSILRKGYTKIICVHHEQAACMAAIGYYRMHNEMPAVLVTTGAGSTNAVTGVVSAWLDSIPCLIISGNENSKYTSQENPLRGWGVQGYDSSDMVSKVSKYAERVLDAKDTIKVLETALAIATSGRPGPCWVDVPMNIQSTPVLRQDFKKFKPSGETSSTKLFAFTAKIGAEHVMTALKSARRPVIWLGHGIRLAQSVDLIEPLINLLQAPVLVSWAGIDMIDSSHPLLFGRAGVYGQRAANFVLQNRYSTGHPSNRL
jgi:acetolactate synthase-1/2/3 large subunit